MADNFWRTSGNDEAANIFQKWQQEEIDTSKEVVLPPSNILSECPKFRIFIIGGTGVGKSTICSQVFQIPERLAGVSHNKRGEHDIEEEQSFRGINEKILIHGLRGFEKGGETTFNEVREFIKKRWSAASLADQFYCIWQVLLMYCISCEDEDKGIQKIEEDFFKNLEEIVGKILVIIVFTRYDKMINKRYSSWMAKNRKRHARGEITDETMYAEIRDAANRKFEKLLSQQWGVTVNEFSEPHIRMANLAMNVDSDENDEDLGEELLDASSMLLPVDTNANKLFIPKLAWRL